MEALEALIRENDSRGGARGNLTTYSHDAAGRQVAAQVNDNGFTPTKTFSYDQLGRMISAVTQGVASYRYIYNDLDQVIEEQIIIPTVNGNLERNLVRSYDSYGRMTGYQLKQGNAVEQEIIYEYTLIGQLEKVIADNKEFSYIYVPNAPQLISRIIAPVHTVSNSYETTRNILSSKTNRWRNKIDTPVISQYTYNVNRLGQRTSVATTGEAFDFTPADWMWGYDALGQVITSNNDRYNYDQIGNRRNSMEGNELENVYTTNALNQYSRIGTTTLTYDADGNQLTGLTPTEGLSGRDTLTFTYNAENRPVKVVQNGEVREAYSYDHMGRRIHKGDTITLYDGYNAIAEYKGSTRTIETTYAWGNDLSNTTQDSGGVGGLLMVTEHEGQLPRYYYPLYDGNGNITEYLNNASQSMVVHYEYNAFGKIIRKTGDKNFTYQFSTKPYDILTGLSYYNYRNYDSVSGRWIGRDLFEEKGGINLYNFVANCPSERYDLLGAKMLKQNCITISAQIRAGLYLFLGADINGTATVNLCDCCNTETGEIIKRDSIFVDISARANAGIGLGIYIPFKYELMFKGPTVGLEIPLSGGFDCDGKGYFSTGVSIPVFVGGEVSAGFGVSVSGSIGINAKLGVDFKVTKDRTSIGLSTSGSADISVSVGLSVLSVGYTWRVPFGGESADWGVNY